MRVGLGNDIHRTKKGGPLILGGVRIPSDFELQGHSDADVLVHSVIDALLGAMGRGDIGEWFSDQDSKNLNRCSMDMLQEVMNFCHSESFVIINVDNTVIAEKPKLAAYKRAIEKSLAEVLQISVSQVNVKAKTYERLGHLGRSEAIEAHTVVLIRKEKG